MGVELYTGTEMKTGTIYLWNGSELIPGEVKMWPWTDVGSGTLTGVDQINGGTPATTSFGVGLSGGVSDTNYSALDVVDGGNP